MPHRPIDVSRRRWLKCMPAAALAAAAPAALAQGQKPAAARVEEADPQAAALGYRHDATKVDKAKFPGFQSGQLCSNCNFYKAKDASAWAPCDILGGKQVSAKGWCAAWVKKA